MLVLLIIMAIINAQKNYKYFDSYFIASACSLFAYIFSDFIMILIVKHFKKEK